MILIKVIPLYLGHCAALYLEPRPKSTKINGFSNFGLFYSRCSFFQRATNETNGQSFSEASHTSFISDAS
jgi:hypothetical protein